LAAGVYEERRPDISGFLCYCDRTGAVSEAGSAYDVTVYITVIYVYKETHHITRHTLPFIQ